MIEVLAILFPIALINSVWILPYGVLGVVSSLVTPKPTLTASAFIGGILLPHFLFGLLLAIGVDTAIEQATAWLQETWRGRDLLLVLLQLVIGVVMVLFGYRLSYTEPNSPPPGDASSIQMSPLRAFSVSAGFTTVKLPGGLLYFAAIEQILRADPPVSAIVKSLLFYNLVFLSPLILTVLARHLLRERVDRLLAGVSAFLDKWGKRLVFFGMLGVGVILVVDAVGWFFGAPLLPRYLL
jgi:hypothetical protein